MTKDRQDPELIVADMIHYIGDDPTREGLYATPERVVKSWDELFAGYKIIPSSLMTWFLDDTDEMVMSKNIQFFSTCEHHLLPFFGHVDIAYIPDGKVLGLSKFSRIVEAYSRRLQIQENLTREIAELLEPYTQGVAVHIEAQHLCMMARGVRQNSSTMVTNKLTGHFLNDASARAEFLGAVQ